MDNPMLFLKRRPDMLIEKVIEKAFGLLPALMGKIPNLQVTISKPVYSFATQTWSADFIRVGLAPEIKGWVETVKVELPHEQR